MADPGGGRLVGQTISHYRVIAPLGAGGMGVVYRGEDVRLNRPVAIKFVADDFAHDQQALARLRAEARAASALNHPNICTVYDIGAEEGRPFIVMELMEGQTLRDRLARGHLRVHELVDYGIQIADALQCAHSAGIIHRDIKPANIFLTTGGHVKVLDFGLAKLASSHPRPDSATLGSTELTAAGTTLGTVSYMSPEQASGEDLDGRTDLFSLGVVLYECATGRQPFEGKTHAVILSAIMNRAPVAPVALNPELPVRVQEIILACLEKDRELRYQSAADLRADLKRVRRDLESGRMPVGTTATLPTEIVTEAAHPIGAGATATGRGHGSAHGSTPSAPSTAAITPRTRTPLVAAGVGVIAVLALGGYVFRRPAPREVGSAAVTSGNSVPASGDAIDGRLALAQSNLAAGNYRAAQAYASEVLAADPGRKEARDIRDRSAAALDRFDEAVALARQLLAASDVQGAARALGSARDIDPTSPVVTELAATLAQRVRENPAPTRDAAAPASQRNQRPAVATTPSASPGAGQAAAGQKNVETSPPTPAAAPASAAATPPPAAAPAPPVSPATSAASTPPLPTPPPAAAAPPPPAPRNTAPATEPASRAQDDDAAVRRVVASYARAIESKDLSLFRTVKPNLSREEERRVQEGFRAVASQQVHLTVESVDIRDQDASVVARRRDVIEAGGRRQTVESRQTFRLARNPGGWVITDIR